MDPMFFTIQPKASARFDSSSERPGDDRFWSESAWGVGDLILARFERGATYYPGTITKVHDNGTYDILYDDSDVEGGLEAEYIVTDVVRRDAAHYAAPRVATGPDIRDAQARCEWGSASAERRMGAALDETSKQRYEAIVAWAAQHVSDTCETCKSPIQGHKECFEVTST